MTKTTIFTFLMMSTFCLANAQSEDSYVRFYGKVLGNKDSVEVPNATISYEKLPYYDDMGMARSDVNGNYEFYLVKGNQYNFRILAGGYEDYDQQITVEDPDSDEAFNYNFLLMTEELPEVITLHDLIFATSRAEITPSSFKELDELAEYMEENPGIRIQLEGHTDFGGNPEAAMDLSQARVEAVKEYLRDKGIDKKRILTKAFGGTQPIVTEGGPEERAQNRRVEVRIIRR